MQRKYLQEYHRYCLFVSFKGKKIVMGLRKEGEEGIYN